MEVLPAKVFGHGLEVICRLKAVGASAAATVSTLKRAPTCPPMWRRPSKMTRWAIRW